MWNNRRQGGFDQRDDDFGYGQESPQDHTYGQNMRVSRQPQAEFPLGGMSRNGYMDGNSMFNPMDDSFRGPPGGGLQRPRGGDGRGPPPPFGGGYNDFDGGMGNDSRLRYAPDMSLDSFSQDRHVPNQGGNRKGGGKGKGGDRNRKGEGEDPMSMLSGFDTDGPMGQAPMQLPTGMPLGSLLPPGVSERQAVPPPGWANTTTIMMRNLPNKYTQRMLLTEVNQVGFLGTFDFLYLPIDTETAANRGYAFLNFIDPSFAWMFKISYEGRKMNRFNSSKVVSVMPATLQGFDANYTHYSSARVNRGDPAARPLFLREPTHPVLKAAGRDGFNKRGNRRKGAPNGEGPPGPGGPPATMTAGGDRVTPPWSPDEDFGGPELPAIPVMGGASEADASLDRPAVPKFCPHCGGPIQAHFQFCPHCGSNVDFTGAAP